MNRFAMAGVIPQTTRHARTSNRGSAGGAIAAAAAAAAAPGAAAMIAESTGTIMLEYARIVARIARICRSNRLEYIFSIVLESARLMVDGLMSARRASVTRSVDVSLLLSAQSPSAPRSIRNPPCGVRSGSERIVWRLINRLNRHGMGYERSEFMVMLDGLDYDGEVAEGTAGFRNVIGDQIMIANHRRSLVSSLKCQIISIQTGASGSGQKIVPRLHPPRTPPRRRSRPLFRQTHRGPAHARAPCPTLASLRPDVLVEARGGLMAPCRSPEAVSAVMHSRRAAHADAAQDRDDRPQ